MRQFVLRPMTNLDARLIARWHYDPPYDFYDFAADPDDLAELLNPENFGQSYFSVYDDVPSLIGFFQFNSVSDAVETGLGLRPDLTGQGWGASFVQKGLAFAATRFRPQLFRLRVAAFNQRAIRVYEQLGFRSVRVFHQETNGSLYEFFEMERKA